jgi:hypothetical protein
MLSKKAIIKIKTISKTYFAQRRNENAGQKS